MRALRLMSWKSDAVLVDVPEPVAGPGQVVIRVGGAGACHSDVALMHEYEDGTLGYAPPFTLGHENAGWVHAVGEGVRTVRPGDAVAVFGAWGCGRCARCAAGIDTYCEDVASAPVSGGGGGLGLDGGMADLMLIPDERFLVPLPEGLHPADAAPLTDAGLTPYHAIRRSWPKLVPGSTAVVIGVGGLGHLATQILRATTGARIVAVDTRADALRLAAECGADGVLLSGPTTRDEVRELTRGKGADVVLDFVGNDATMALGASMVRHLGDLTIVGIGGGTLPVGFFTLAFEASVQTTYWGSRPELREVLALAAAGRIEPRTTRFPLERALEAYGLMSSGDLEGRAVIVPHES